MSMWTPDPPFVNGPAGGTPWTADAANHVEGQYAAAVAYTDAFKGKLPVNAKDYGATLNLTTLNAALDAAEARGKHTPVYVSGVWDVGNGLSMNGRTALLIGDGSGGTEAAPTGTTIYASTQSGPVIDWSGWVSPGPGFGGKVLHGGFTVQGSNVADATLANCGMKFTAISSVTFADIAIRHTGGPCIDMASSPGNAVYLSDFERIILHEPVSMSANDVPFFRANECNGNRFRGFGLMGRSHTIGVSGAVQILGNASFSPTDNLFDGWWFEALNIPTGGTIFSHKGNSSVISNFQFFDVFKVAAATGTSFFRFTAPTVSNFGCNLITGVIPGAGGASDPDMGVDMQQFRNRVQGTKAYRGFSGAQVVLASGVLSTFVDLAGAYTPGSPAVIDNSGNQTNIIQDTTALQFPPTGGTGFRRVQSGRFYGAADHSTTTAAQTDGTSVAVPFWLPVAASFTEIDIEVTAAVAATNVRLGIYANDPSKDCPAALVLDAGTVVASTTGVKTLAITQTLQAGLYWLSATPQGGAPTLRAIANALAPVANNAAGGSMTSPNCYTMTGVSGALGTWSATVTAASIAPKIMLKAA